MSDHDKAHIYEKIEFLGEGQFATVYKARDLINETIVAVKKIKLGSREEAADGLNRTALREIKLLRELHHPNLIGLLDVFGHRSEVSLVFDFMDTDLEVIIKDGHIILTPAHIKAYLLQILLGLEYMHAHWVLHRDLKPNNLLVNKQGVLKITDFGLARTFGSPRRVYTHQVVTRWYRAPELLFGARKYGVGVDIWAVGCIVVELLLKTPLFPGDTDLDQLDKIFQVTGVANETRWPGVQQLPDFLQFNEAPQTSLADICPAAGDDLLLLVQRMLSLDPRKRCSAKQALEDEYCSNVPPPTPGSQLPLPGIGQQERKRKADWIGASGEKLGRRLEFD